MFKRSSEQSTVGKYGMIHSKNIFSSPDSAAPCLVNRSSNSAFFYRTNINHKGLQRTANEYAGERRIYKDLISKNEK